MIKDQITVLINTGESINFDTSLLSNDTLFVDISEKSVIEIPDKRLEVNTYSEKSNLEIVGIWAAIFGGIAALIGAFIAFRELFKKGAEMQSQLKELKDQTKQLIRQNDLFEKRLRMSVKPRIWSNGFGIRRYENEFNVSVDNRGKLAFLDSIEFLNGDKVQIRNWNESTIIIEEETGNISITGNYGDLNPDTMNFRFLIKYHDIENYDYETEFEWINGSAKIKETREL